MCIRDSINCHVHTADPGKILTHAIQYGYLTNFKIENMHEQFLARQKQGKGLEKMCIRDSTYRIMPTNATTGEKVLG